MNRKVTLMAAACAAMMLSPLQAMEEMAMEELAGITGQEGISLGLELRMNADAQGQPLNAGCGATIGTGAPLASFANNNCRIASQGGARQNFNGGEWLVAKNFFARILIPSLYIDSGRTPIAPTIYEDLDRFRDEDGTPLLTTPHDIPALKLRVPETIELSMQIGGLSIEYGPTAYLNNNSYPFLGMKIGNSDAGLPAEVRLEGTLTVFGF